jgi:hypothetical protein
MTRRGLATLALLSVLALPALAHADEPQPSPERIKAAAEEFDRGRRAYLAKDFEQAAVHFENAYRDAPRAETLRLAIRARRDAKQLARAATLAAIAQQRYPEDASTKQLAKETLEAAAPQLHEYAIDCSVECAVAADGRVVSQSDALHHRIFLDPGSHDLGISFSQGRAAAKKIEATRGGKDTLAFEAPPLPPVERPPPPPGERATRPPPPPPPPPAREKPLGPVVFFVGAGLTAAAGAATIWSGIDTQNAPGVDAVRRECAGKDASCPAYQEGQDKELRTNVALGATIGLAVVTGVIGVFFTQWSSTRPEASAGLRVGPGGVVARF